MENKMRMFFIIPFLFFSCLTTSPVFAILEGGVGIGTTRLVYKSSDKEQSVSIINTNKNQAYLIQCWVSDVNRRNTDVFVVTPPLFVLKPSNESLIRIQYIGDALPQDRESLFWFNVKNIAAENPEELERKNILRLAIISSIKIFYRPAGLSGNASEAIDKIEAKRENTIVKLVNPTPYFANLVNIRVGNKEIDPLTIPPFNSVETKVSINALRLQFQGINDFGALSEQKILNIH